MHGSFRDNETPVTGFRRKGDALKLELETTAKEYGYNMIV